MWKQSPPRHSLLQAFPKTDAAQFLLSADEKALVTVLIERGGAMLHYALVFLVVALIAAALGVSGVAAVATNIAYVLFVIAIVLFLVHLVSGRRPLAP
jgi:uncharacterized membrane protein YtjA (UPF0391 family)